MESVIRCYVQIVFSQNENLSAFPTSSRRQDKDELNTASNYNTIGRAGDGQPVSDLYEISNVWTVSKVSTSSFV